MAYDALHTLYSRRLTSIAVVSEEGRFISSVSLNDFLEIFRTKQHKTLSATLRAFVVHIRSRATEEVAPIVHRHTKASHAVHKLIKSAQKTVWIIDSKNQPIGVIQPLDVISTLV